MRLQFKGEHTIRLLINPVFLLLVVLLLSACRAVRNAPKGVPYVYNNDVTVKSDDLAPAERTLLAEKLYLYIDDSLQIRTRQVVGLTQRLRPPVFDSANVNRSISFMNGYLNALGYYGATFTTKVSFDTLREKKEIRATTNFTVTLGKNLRVDTVVYQMKSPELQRLADSTRKDAMLKKNSSYSKELMGAELDRLAVLFRNAGFMRLTRAALIAEGDTTDPTLVSFDADPIEQLIAAQKRKEDPRIKLIVMQRPGIDSLVFQQYYVDSVFIYPQTKITEETDDLLKDTAFTIVAGRRPIVIKQRNDFFSTRMIRRSNYLLPDSLYNEAFYYRTVNNYWRMGPWQQVDVKTILKYDSVPKADFHLFLIPAKKQSFQLDLEGSQNNNISVSNTLSGRFLAISLNGSMRNRNLFGTGTQSITSARFGFELNNARSDGGQFFQTLLASANQSFSIPRLLPPFSFLRHRQLDFTRTQLSFGASYTDRFNFYKQTAFNATLQWEWRKGRNSYSLALPNFESVSIEETDSLRKEVVNNPSLQYAFTPGNILSTRATWEHTLKFNNRRKAGYWRIAGEVSPFRFKVFNKESFRFVRLDGQLVHSIQMPKATSWNFRAYGGIGWDISGRGDNATLPYFRQFVAGGSNSMRAWGLRQLGVGKSIVSDTLNYADRFGDIQLEANAEYRFPLFRLFGFNVGGAGFVDVGNIWNHFNNADDYGKFELKNLYRDLALCAGTGLRVDVSYLVIRFDMAYKVKDPVREGDGWMKSIKWRETNRLGVRPRGNVGFQFGIGYPF